MENLIEIIKSETTEQENNPESTLDNDMLNRRTSYSKDSMELEYYRKENSKLEAALKLIQKNYDKLIIDLKGTNIKKDKEMELLAA